MRLLLDTHIAIWALASPHRLTDFERDLISTDSNEIYVSAVSIWEIAIKRALGRSGAPPFSSLYGVAAFREAGYLFIDVTVEHAAAVETLPLRHQDPFDRLLVAQSLLAQLQLVTRDRTVASYRDDIICT